MKFWNTLKTMSKKNLIAALTAVTLGANAAYNGQLDMATQCGLLLLVCTWLLSRGIADHGAGGTVRGSIQRGSALHSMATQIMGVLQQSADKEVRVTRDGQGSGVKLEVKDAQG